MKPFEAIYDDDAGDFVTMDITDQIESASDDGCFEKIKQTMSKTRISIVIIVLLISIGLSFILIFSIYIINAHSYKVNKNRNLPTSLLTNN